MSVPDADAYSLKSATVAAVAAPDLPYRPPMPDRYRPRIALIGAGGIAFAHLDAYRRAGFDVAVICNRTLAKAVARRDEFFPSAEATDDIAGTIARPDIAVVDLTLHPHDRAPLIDAALNAGKHVLSQKPFVLDLDLGARLADLADARGLVLAVNQNGRWAPHFAYAREAVRAGLLGDLHSVQTSVHWDHSWIAGTAFEAVPDLILTDFGVHWFDFLTSLIGRRADSVFAASARASGQTAAPPFLSQALVAFPGGQAALLFDASTRWGSEDRTVVTGSLGTLRAVGPDLGSQRVTLTTAAGQAEPVLEGAWFNDGFTGTMGALLTAVETGVPPLNTARDNLNALALVFAAVASARRGVPVVPGTVRSLAEARG